MSLFNIQTPAQKQKNKDRRDAKKQNQSIPIEIEDTNISTETNNENINNKRIHVSNIIYFKLIQVDIYVPFQHTDSCTKTKK